MLKFDPEKHIYSFNDRVVPGVTGILDQAGMVESTFFTPEACQRGTAVHKGANLIDDDCLDWNTVHENYVPYLQAYEKYLNENKVEWHYVETKVFDPILFYAGTLDREGIINREYCIIDIKTGTPHDWAKMQTMAYKHARKVGATRRILQLKSNGKYKLHPPYEDDQKDFAEFKAALVVANWKQRNKAWLEE
jgi:hypothetical protein